MSRLPEGHPLIQTLRKDPHLREAVFPDSENPYTDVPDSLVTSGVKSADEMLVLLEDFYEIPSWPLKEININQELFIVFPQNFCEEMNILPLLAVDDQILMAMADPWDLPALSYFKTKAGKNIVPLISLKSQIQDALKYFSKSSAHYDAEMKGIFTRQAESARDVRKEVAIVEDSESPVVKLVNYILHQGITLSASDIHLEPYENFSNLRYRIDGVLHRYEGPPQWMYGEVISRIKVMSNLDVAETRVPQDGRITFRIDGRSVEFRVSTMRFAYGEGVVLRILDKTGVVLDIKKLGFPDDLLPIFEKAVKSPHGLILVSGPTGSGKSTTLYATLGEISTPDKKVISVEDPVEYKMNSVCQSAVRSDIGYTFGTGMRAILRHDPDIVMIGEMRDQESAEIAIRAALTGHLVLSTIHTNDSVSVVTRLVDMGIPHFLVSATLRLAIAQRLVRRLCPQCRKEKRVAKQELEDFGLPASYMAELADKLTLYEPIGCEACKNIGFKGRMAVYEILDATGLFKHMKSRNESLQELTDEALQLGLRTLRVNGIMKAIAGDTSLEEVIKITADF